MLNGKKVNVFNKQQEIQGEKGKGSVFSHWTTKRTIVSGVTAGIYAVLTILVPSLTYGPLQIRFSEMLNLLVFINPVFGVGVVLGCFFANMFSPNGMLMELFGVFASICAAYCITRTKNMFLASLWPTIFMVFVAVELFLLGFVDPLGLGTTEPSIYAFLLLYGVLMAGEFVAVTLIGYPVFLILLKNNSLVRYLKSL